MLINSEPIGWEFMGLEANEQFLFTRIHQWTIALKLSNDDDHSQTTQAAKKSTGGTRRGSEAAAPEAEGTSWTS